MFGAILTATNSSFQKGMTFCRSTYVKKVMKLLAFIFEQPSYSCDVCFIISHEVHVPFFFLNIDLSPCFMFNLFPCSLTILFPSIWRFPFP